MKFEACCSRCAPDCVLGYPAYEAMRKESSMRLRAPAKTSLSIWYPEPGFGVEVRNVARVRHVHGNKE
jgi:hypothetical protein